MKKTTVLYRCTSSVPSHSDLTRTNRFCKTAGSGCILTLMISSCSSLEEMSSIQSCSSGAMISKLSNRSCHSQYALVRYLSSVVSKLFKHVVSFWFFWRFQVCLSWCLFNYVFHGKVPLLNKIWHWKRFVCCTRKTLVYFLSGIVSLRIPCFQEYLVCYDNSLICHYTCT